MAEKVQREGDPVINETQRFAAEADKRDRDARILRNYDRSRATPNGLSASLAAIGKLRPMERHVAREPYPCGDAGYEFTWISRRMRKDRTIPWRIW